MTQRSKTNEPYSMDPTTDSVGGVASDYLRSQLASRSMPKILCPIVEGELLGFDHFNHDGEPRPQTKETL